MTRYLGFAIAVLLFVCWLLIGAVSDAQHERDAAVRDLQSANRAILELAIERAAADRRAEIVRTSKVEILEADDGEVAPTLWTGLRSADKIGGIQ